MFLFGPIFRDLSARKAVEDTRSPRTCPEYSDVPTPNIRPSDIGIRYKDLQESAEACPTSKGKSCEVGTEIRRPGREAHKSSLLVLTLGINILGIIRHREKFAVTPLPFVRVRIVSKHVEGTLWLTVTNSDKQ